MKNKIMEGINKQLNGEAKDTFEQFMHVLSYPDDTFKVMYPALKETVMKICEGVEFQQEMLRQMKVLPLGTVAENREAIDDMLQEFDEDDSLCEEKRDFIHLIFDSVLEVYEQLINHGRQMIKVKFCRTNPEAKVPEYAHSSDAGADVFAVETTVIPPKNTVLVKTGITMAIPEGYEIQVRPRSGLSLKSPLRVANAPGTIDAHYRGEVAVIMTNTGNEPYTINKYDKIAQFIIAPVPMIKWTEIDDIKDLGETDRGDGGYGSTDKKS